MKELIIEFGNDTLGETRMYQRNPKGYEQAIKDMKLYKSQQKAEIDYLKSQIKAECKEHQEAMRLANKTINKLEKALELVVKYYVNLNNCDFAESCWKTIIKDFKNKVEEMIKDAED